MCARGNTLTMRPMIGPVKAAASIAVLLIPMLVTMLVAGCEKRTTAQEYRPGGIYSIQDENGYGVVKILVVDSKAVHIRIYKNKFTQRPAQIDLTTLKIGSMNDPDGFGIGHLPLSKAAFASWHPVFVTQTTVRQEELAGYEEWKKANGGVFGEPH